VFGLRIPDHVEGVPPEILNPRSISGDEAAYDQRARKLAADFKENFEPFRDHVPEGVVRSMP
jgi:phosphoenolpyruvate carboxykinase (ATP)